MKAAVFHGPLDIRVEDVKEPTLEEGDTLIKVKACGICGSDLHAYKLGLFHEVGLPVNSGMILGHEFSGEIVRVTGNQQEFRVGDRVTAMCMGALAEYVKIPAWLSPLMLKFPPEISYEEAATCEPLTTSFNAVNLANPANGETHVILGVGGIGLGILQVIKSRCSAKVIAVDLSDKRLDLAKKLGAVPGIRDTNVMIILKNVKFSFGLSVDDMATSPKDLDSLDLALIKELEADGRLNNSQLAKRLRISWRSVRSRLERLVGEGILQRLHQRVHGRRAGR